MVRRTNSMIENRKCSSPRACLRSEKGSALVLVMFIVLLLTILGVAVLSATIGGAQRTETRENDVQSLHFAQKTIDEALAYITVELNEKIEDSSSMTQGEIDEYIKSFLKTIDTNKKEFISRTELEGATSEITQIIIDPESPSGEHTVTIKANATVNGVLRTLQQKIKITTFPDFLNYSLGSEGTVYLNGAPTIKGNIYAGKELKVSRVAEYIHNANLTQSSLFSFIDGEAQVQSMQKLLYSENGKLYAPTTEVINGFELDKRVQQIRDNAKVKKNTTFVQINVEDSFLDKAAEAVGSIEDKAIYSDIYYGSGGPQSDENAINRGTRLITSLQQSSGVQTLKLPHLEDYNVSNSPPEGLESAEAIGEESLSLTAEEKSQQLYEEAMQQLKEKLGNLLNSMIFDGDLNLNGVDFDKIKDLNKTSTSTQNPSWFIVNGDLTLDNYSTQPITIQSNILVTGNLYIKGNITFDSTMFVLGNTEIINATITGISGKELVLISKGAILINRVEEFKDKATMLRAFFYTDSTAHLYGVGSIFSLDGGFFAKGDLTINAVVGKVSQQEGYAEFDFDTQIESADPRFIVNYNKDVFENQYVGLPRVNQINIQVGPIELMQPGS